MIITRYEDGVEEYKQRWQEEAPHIPYGCCQCGCGQKTTISNANCKANGYVLREPKRFIAGHQTRKSALLYEEVDAGYESPCWLWLRGLTSDGYGTCRVDGERVYAHRVFYERAHGSVPPEYHVHHKCEQRSCVNPDHLETLTPLEHNHSHGVIGETHATAKLTEDDVRSIWDALECGETQTNLAKRFGVSQSNISVIKLRKGWRHVTPGGAS